MRGEWMPRGMSSESFIYLSLLLKIAHQLIDIISNLRLKTKHIWMKVTTSSRSDILSALG
jgi:hypothetical protein